MNFKINIEGQSNNKTYLYTLVTSLKSRLLNICQVIQKKSSKADTRLITSNKVITLFLECYFFHNMHKVI